uniref:Uncharacterized protein n=1 Tax=Pseudomonas phage Baskent_P2_ICU TaxID=3235054 RepID=A0AB39AIB5_9CAUD
MSRQSTRSQPPTQATATVQESNSRDAATNDRQILQTRRFSHATRIR